MAIHIFTSVTCNYIPKARVLAQTVKRWHPEYQFHIVIPDAIPDWFQVEREPFDSVIRATELGIRNVDQWLFKHSVVEACTAVKGAALRKLLGRRDCSAALYFDPDMAVMSSLQGLVSEFDNASVLLTPHLTEPEKTVDAVLDNEFSVLRHGIYNLGFIGVKKSEAGIRFADWWADRLYEFCYDDIPRGIFTDQRWVDLAPACFDGIRILRDPQYNVATWNLTHRKVTGSVAQGFLVNGRPLAFYHFSGFDSGAQEAMLNKYGSSMPALFELREWYIAECERMGQNELGSSRWSYAHFDNGRPVTALHRKRYREREDLQQTFPNPYSTADITRSFYHWFEAHDESRVGASVVPPPPVPAGRMTTGPVEIAEPRYRIVVSVCGIAEDVARQGIRRILAHSRSRANIQVIGGGDALAALFAGWSPEVVCERIPVPDGATTEEALTLAMKQVSAGIDLLFVRADCAVPQWWDIRLAWAAKRAPGTATVSPVMVRPEEAQATDAAYYQHSLFAQPAIETFSRSCVYICHQSAQDAGSFRSSGEFSSKVTELCWSHILADHLCVGGAENPGKTTVEAEAVIQDLREAAGAGAAVVDLRRSAARRQLHIMHSWGGGLEHWVREYCRNDSAHQNFVLKSMGSWAVFGQELWLYRHIDDETPVRQFALSPSVKHTADRHHAYRAAIEQIVHEFGIDAVIVSSLIGHSLDVFRTGLPTLMVCHDFYPFCPALNITFGSVCRTCGEGELQQCTRENPHHRFFRNVPPAEWTALRREFPRAVSDYAIRMIAPSPSVVEEYCQFLPELREHFHVIPHGARVIDKAPLQLRYSDSSRLRVLIPGSLAPQKGGHLLKVMLPALLEFADVYLVGCGEWGAAFSRKGVTIVPSYEWDQLPALLEPIRPHVGLLLSVVPETFSYTLRELSELAIPPVATRLGSFTDYIDDGVNGFLVDPDPEQIVERLRSLAQDHARLAAVHHRLRATAPWRMGDMLAQYEAALALPHHSATAYFAQDNRTMAMSEPGPLLQLMWRPRSRGFEKQSSTQMRLQQSHEAHTVVLRIPASPEPLAALRLNLGNQPGFVLLHGIRLVNSHGAVVWSWSSREGRIAPTSCSEIVWLGGDTGALLYLSGAHPHIALPLDESALSTLHGGEGSAEVDIAAPPVNEAMAKVAASVFLNGDGNAGTADRDRLIRHMAAQLMTQRSRPQAADLNAERLLQQITALRARVQDLESSLSWRITAPLRQVAGAVLEATRSPRGGTR